MDRIATFIVTSGGFFFVVLAVYALILWLVSLFIKEDE